MNLFLRECRDPGKSLWIHPHQKEAHPVFTEEQLARDWEYLLTEVAAIHLVGDELLGGHCVWDVFDYLGDLEDSAPLAVSLHSSLLIGSENLDRLILKSHYLKNFSLVIPRLGQETPELARTETQLEALDLLIRYGRLRKVCVNNDELALRLRAEGLPDRMRPGFFDRMPEAQVNFTPILPRT